MNKNELVKSLAEKSELSQKDCKKVLEAFLETVTETLTKREKIQLIGFGSFYASHRKARKGRNPHDGSEIQIPESYLPKFKAGKSLKDSVNNK